MNMCPEKLSSKSQGRKQPILSVCAQYSQTVTAIGTGVKIHSHYWISTSRKDFSWFFHVQGRRYGSPQFPWAEIWRHISGDMFMEQSGHDFARNKIGQYTNALKWITCFLLDPV